MSSLLAIAVSALMLLPVYTANNVSNALSVVSIVTGLADGAVQLYQTEAPPGSPAWSGSPFCLVALALLPLIEPELPLIGVAEANASFAGATPVLSDATALVTEPNALVTTT